MNKKGFGSLTAIASVLFIILMIYILRGMF